jgi:hypothetical protein
MRQRTILIASFALILLAMALPLGVAAELRLEITSPSVGERIRGRVPIIGSAQVPDFQFYKVEWGIGPNPSQWAVIGELREQPVIAGQLQVWDTTVLPDDVYTLRLTGVKRDGNWEEFYVRNVVVANQQAEATPTPEETPTPEVEMLPTPTPVESQPVVGQPTPDPAPGPESATPDSSPDVQIIAPIDEIVSPTVTPRVNQVFSEDRLPIETGTLGQSFVFGAVAMGAVFLLLGVVFGIRRLF